MAETTATKTDSNAQVVTYRKRMRGIATFFVIISLFGIAVTLLRLGFSDGAFTGEKALDAAVNISVVLILSLMSWNSSRVAPVLLALWFGTTFLSLTTADLATSAITYIRTIIYSGLAIIMAWNAFRLSAALKRNASPRPGSKVIRIAGYTLLTPLALLMAAGLWFMSEGVSNRVLDGNDIPQEYVDWMRDKDFLENGENALVFYSAGMTSIAEDGNILTNEYVGSWFVEDDETYSSWIKLGEVCSITLKTKGSYFVDAVYEIASAEEDDSFQIYLSVEDGRHKIFLDRLRHLNNRKMDSDYKAVCDSGAPIDWQKFALAKGLVKELVSDEAVPEAHRDWLIENEYLHHDETIEAYYNSGNYKLQEGGVMLSDQYFGGWFISDGEKDGWWKTFDKICDVIEVDSTIDQRRRYKATTADTDNWYKFYLPAAEDIDRQIVSKIKDRSAAAMSDEQRAACAAKTDETP